MGLFKKDKIILNTPNYKYLEYTYYYADNKLSDKPIRRDSKEAKEIILDSLEYLKSTMSHHKYASGSPVYSLLEYLRSSEIEFTKDDYYEIEKSFKEFFPYKINDILHLIECMAIFSDIYDRKSRY